MIPFVSSLHPSRPLCLMLLLLLLLPTLCVAQTAGPTVNGQPTEQLSSRQLWGWGYWSSVYDYAMAGQVLVSLLPAVGQAELDRMLVSTGCRVLHRFQTPQLYLIGLPQGMTIPDGLARMRAQSIVKSASPDQVTYVSAVPNDTQYGTQWHWNAIGMETAWDVQTGSASTVVAVIDSGVDLLHEDLAGRFWTNPGEVPGNGMDDDGNGLIDDVNGYDFARGSGNVNPDDDSFSYYNVRDHGTHMAGIIGANGNNALGVAGADWSCRLMPVKVFADHGTPASTVMKGFEYAVSEGVDIINLSLTSFYVAEWTPVIARAYQAGITVVAAVGNRGWYWDYYNAYTTSFTDREESWLSPVCNDGPMLTDNYVIGVGSVDDGDTLSQFTIPDRSHRRFVDVMAPGQDIYSTGYYGGLSHDGYWAVDGTSAAAAIVTGLSALILAETPGSTPSAIRQRIANSCIDLSSLNPRFVGMLGAGRVSASACFLDNVPGVPRSVQAQDTPGDEGGSITISWSRSLDDGQGANDITRYAIFRAESAEGPFAQVGEVAPGVTEFIDTPVDDGVDYYYQVVAYDARMSASSPVTSPVQARDDQAPAAVEFSVEDTAGDEGGSITVRWSAYSAPDDFREFRIYRETEAFTSVQGLTPLARVTNRQATSYQDQAVTDNTDYYYAVTAVDNEVVPNELTQVSSVGPVRANPNYAFSFPAGLSMISLGLHMQDLDLSQFIAQEGASLCRYDPEGNRYVMVPGLTSAELALLRHSAGKGYWLRTPAPLSLNLSGSAPTTDVALTFAAGWNQLGNPYVDEVSILGARVEMSGTSLTLQQSNDQGLTAGYVWIYDNTSRAYKLVSEFLPFSQQTIRRGDGFFFYASRPGRLILRNPRTVGVQQVGPARVQPSVNSWVMRLCASTEGAADTDNFLGVSAQAASLNGVVSPPAVEAGLDLTFTSGETRSATEFVQSLGTGREWTAEVACTAPGAKVTLSWPDLSQLPRQCRAVLRDKATGQTVYMRTTGGYSFTMQPETTTRQFVVEISSKVGDLLAISSLQAGATPDGAQVSYSLSAPAEVEIAVVNMAGRPVRRFAVVEAQSGVNVALWDRRNSAGLRVPNGLYLVRLSARTAEGQVVSAVQSLSLGR